MKELRYVGPISVVDLPTLGILDWERGTTREVPDDVVGEGPRWRRADVESDRIDIMETREHAGHLEVLDLGSGLLAQLGNFEVVEAKAATEKQED